MMQENGLPRRRSDLLDRELEGELALFDVESGEVHTLNPSAAAVWSLMADCGTREELVGELAALFAIEREEAEEGVRRALEDFLDAGLLEEGAQGGDGD